MQQPLQITFRGLGHSDAIEQRIREKAAELERFYDPIISCHVAVEADQRRHQQGNLFNVRVDLHVPDKSITAGHERKERHAHEDVYVAIRDTFDAATRQLEDYARKRRGQTKKHEVPTHGRVTKLFADDGYGFIVTTDGTEVYFHDHSVTEKGFLKLEVGDEVRLEIADEEGENGPQASTVIPIGKHHLFGAATV